jgi:CheY-like chemotaxis protein
MRNIVIVEDNPDHALIIKKGIEANDCRVSHYEDGHKAVEACRANTVGDEKPNLVFLDINLPGMDGFGVLECLRKLEKFKHIPIVMLTTSARQKEVERAYGLGANGYVVKSENFQQFMAKLQAVKNYWFCTVELPTTNEGA